MKISKSHSEIIWPLGIKWNLRIKDISTAVRDVFNVWLYFNGILSYPKIDKVPFAEPILYLWEAAKLGDLEVYRLFEENIKDKNPVMQGNRYNLDLIDRPSGSYILVLAHIKDFFLEIP